MFKIAIQKVENSLQQAYRDRKVTFLFLRRWGGWGGHLQIIPFTGTCLYWATQQTVLLIPYRPRDDEDDGVKDARHISIFVASAIYMVCMKGVVLWVKPGTRKLSSAFPFFGRWCKRVLCCIPRPETSATVCIAGERRVGEGVLWFPYFPSKTFFPLNRPVFI